MIVLIGLTNTDIENTPNNTTALKKRTNTNSKQFIQKTRDIRVKSIIVKSVSGKHRYFFDIRNYDSKPFDGEVTIKLFTKMNIRIGEETFLTTNAIKPKLGTYVYFDINTGPVSVHGDEGVAYFKYIVKKNKAILSQGKKNISKNFERLN